MEKEVSSDKLTEKKEAVRHPEEKVNKVILVQVAVCAFFILLVFAAQKFSPSTFEFLKSEYNRIMSVDMSTQELLNSAKEVSNDVISNITAESDSTPYETEAQGTGGEDKEDSSAVAVMSSLGKNENIVTPLHGRVTSPYGYRINPISGKYGLHTGVDIAADEGTAIVAAYNGVIKETGYGEKKGNFVLMEHSDGTQTLYCHCSEVLVDEGTVIRAGEAIALVGSTGWSTGPHLHFEIHINGKTVDPLNFIKENGGKV